MHSITLISLSTLLLQQATAKQLEVNQSDDAQSSVADNLVDKMLDRVNQMPLHSSDLDQTTLDKTHPGTIAKQPPMSRLASPLVGNHLVNRPQFHVNAMRDRYLPLCPASASRDVSAAAQTVDKEQLEQLVQAYDPADTASSIKTKVYDLSKNVVGDTTLDKTVFGLVPRPDVIQQVVRWQRCRARVSTASAKSRGFVTGSTKKIQRQKGTGNARKGDKRSPLMKGGGVIFGPTPRRYEFKMPRQFRKFGLRHALSAKQADGRLIVVDNLLTLPKTKEVAKALANFGEEGSKFNIIASTVSSGGDGLANSNFDKATRNIPGVKFSRTYGFDLNTADYQTANVYDIVNADYLIVTKDAVKLFEKTLAKA